ncbi:unnamed protein product [Dicrocoelium dendriticum]|nr:unnamed protein product [Dicrocoelium dendriticum]
MSWSILIVWLAAKADHISNQYSKALQKSSTVEKLSILEMLRFTQVWTIYRQLKMCTRCLLFCAFLLTVRLTTSHTLNQPPYWEPPAQDSEPAPYRNAMGELEKRYIRFGKRPSDEIRAQNRDSPYKLEFSQFPRQPIDFIRFG